VLVAVESFGGILAGCGFELAASYGRHQNSSTPHARGVLVMGFSGTIALSGTKYYYIVDDIVADYTFKTTSAEQRGEHASTTRKD